MADADVTEATRYILDADLLEGVAMGGCHDYRCPCQLVIDSDSTDEQRTIVRWWMFGTAPRGLA